MKKIELTQGRFALVDDEDFEWLNQWKWQAHKHKNTFYAVRNIVMENRQKMIYMHREVLKANSVENVDHIDSNGLHNQKANLRICKHSENMRNRKMPKNNSSGYKGVTWESKRKKWCAQISLDKRHIHIGYFSSPIEAARAYDKIAKSLHGEFAKLNFPDSE